MDKNTTIQWLDSQEDRLFQLSDQIWEHPELGYQEHVSAQLLEEALEQSGFQVTKNLANIPTAFCGQFGTGRPYIGLLGEFDALPELNQQAGASEAVPVENGTSNGHGCGHNLLGVGSLGAALAVKRYLEETGRPGTIFYYGCPAEENGSGKAFMARDGVFDSLDAALSWHPNALTAVWAFSSLAKACSNVLVNNTLERLLHANMSAIPLPRYTQEELDYAKAIQDTIPGRSTLAQRFGAMMGEQGRKLGARYDQQSIYSVIVPYHPSEKPVSGSTDVGDVSWVCPTSQIVATTCAGGTPEHTWQMVAQGKSGPAHKGLLYAAKVLAATVIDLLEQPDQIQAARQEHAERVAHGGFQPLLPPDKAPF